MSTLPRISLSPAQQVSYQKLLEKAQEARERAHAPNSKSKVGAAILGASGEVYQGANFELTRYADHAEQVAINQAILAGEKELKAVAVFIAPESGVTDKAFHGKNCPCGNCRQALFEINPEMHSVDFDGDVSKIKAYRLGDMLPEAYKREWPKEEVGQVHFQTADPLAQAALEARQRSWAPRTGYPEGAAVQTEDGQIFKGCKVELSSFASQAERMAAASAFLKSGKKIVRIAIVGGKGQPETPRDVNWDSLQALHRLNPEMRISSPGQDGQFLDQSLIEFSIARLK